MTSNVIKIRSAFLAVANVEGRTDRYVRNKICIVIAVFPELIQSHTVNVYVYSHTDTVTVMLSILLYSTFTVQILYKLYSLQLNCTYSNYTEAAATCSAAQQERNSQAALLKWNVAGCLELYVYIESHIEWLNPSKKCRRQQTHCHNFTTLHNTCPFSFQATARRLIIAYSSLRMRWRNSGTLRDLAALQHTSTALVRCTSSRRISLPFSPQNLQPLSHAIYSNVDAACGVAIHCSRARSNLPRGEWSDVRPWAVGASLVGLGWP
jgi:hypothetical protein